MQNNNQKIVFSVSEETTPAEIILDILSKNGFKDPADDAIRNEKPRVVIVHSAAKDFFEKKLTEESFANLLQKELKTSKENAEGIIRGVKERLMPFAKKITITDETNQVKMPETVGEKRIEFPIVGEKITEGQIATRLVPKPEKSDGIDVPKREQRRIKKPLPIEKAKESIPQSKQPEGPDTYREPIE